MGVMHVYYYKTVDAQGILTSIQTSPNFVPNTNELIGISEEDYLIMLEEFNLKANQGAESSVTDDESYIAQLERENAALRSELTSVRASLNTIKKGDVQSE